MLKQLESRINAVLRASHEPLIAGNAIGLLREEVARSSVKALVACFDTPNYSYTVEQFRGRFTVQWHAGVLAGREPATLDELVASCEALLADDTWDVHVIPDNHDDGETLITLPSWVPADEVPIAAYDTVHERCWIARKDYDAFRGDFDPSDMDE